MDEKLKLIDDFERAVRANGYRTISDASEREYNETRKALSAALAAAEVQPVAWVRKSTVDWASTTKMAWASVDIGPRQTDKLDTPLYTRPSPPSGEAVEARRLALEEAARLVAEASALSTNHELSLAIRALIPREGKADA